MKLSINAQQVEVTAHADTPLLYVLRNDLGLVGSRTSDEDYEGLLKRMKKRPVDYFRMFYGDTSVNGAASAIQCGIDFYGTKRVLFGTDCPFDPEGGPLFIRETIKALDGMQLRPEDRRRIYFGNAMSMLRLQPPAEKARAKAKKRKK